MKTFQWLCCERCDSPDTPEYHGEIVIIEGLLTPVTPANNRGEALALLNDWFITNKCRPYREVI